LPKILTKNYTENTTTENCLLFLHAQTLRQKGFSPLSGTKKMKLSNS